VSEIAVDMLKFARAGLTRRKHLDASGRDETRYLEILEERLARGTTPAQELLEKFNGPWAGSVDPIYAEEAY
jgi:glutamate--cysteine ligase